MGDWVVFTDVTPGMDWDWNDLERCSAKDFGNWNGVPVKIWKIFA